MIDGILLVDKQVGITSYDVIRKIKGMLESKEKIGHAGTLDPFASGLLLILFGKATKMTNTIHSYEKIYEVEAKLGFCTDTQDITGEILKKDTRKFTPSLEDISLTIEQNFLGNILQIPPIYSAKKIKGRKSYDLAREGIDVQLEPRKIYVFQFEVYEYIYPTIKCKIKCSTGTYIRTLINDLGIELNTYATATNLRRVSIGGFNVKEAVLSNDISKENRENILRRIINI